MASGRPVQPHTESVVPPIDLSTVLPNARAASARRLSFLSRSARSGSASLPASATARTQATHGSTVRPCVVSAACMCLTPREQGSRLSRAGSTWSIISAPKQISAADIANLAASGLTASGFPPPPPTTPPHRYQRAGSPSSPTVSSPVSLLHAPEPAGWLHERKGFGRRLPRFYGSRLHVRSTQNTARCEAPTAMPKPTSASATTPEGTSAATKRTDVTSADREGGSPAAVSTGATVAPKSVRPSVRGQSVVSPTPPRRDGGNVLQLAPEASATLVGTVIDDVPGPGAYNVAPGVTGGVHVKQPESESFVFRASAERFSRHRCNPNFVPRTLHSAEFDRREWANPRRGHTPTFTFSKAERGSVLGVPTETQHLFYQSMAESTTDIAQQLRSTPVRYAAGNRTKFKRFPLSQLRPQYSRPIGPGSFDTLRASHRIGLPRDPKRGSAVFSSRSRRFGRNPRRALVGDDWNYTIFDAHVQVCARANARGQTVVLTNATAMAPFVVRHVWESQAATVIRIGRLVYILSWHANQWPSPALFLRLGVGRCVGVGWLSRVLNE